ncbi:MAG: flagellar assembly protein FliW [Magnetococcales bacterium]|nr:flagellar assembly protein FliW [Magnetococcales bacterium]
MEIHGTRFGVLEFNEDEIIVIEDGLLGFPLSKNFLLFPYGQDSSFFWLQSVDEAEIAFIVVNPFDFFSDLEFEIDDADAEVLDLGRSEDVETFTLVTIPEGRPEEMRTNLAGPVIVNTINRKGKQVLLKGFSPRQPLIPGELRAKYLRETIDKIGQKKQQRRNQRQDKKRSAPLQVATAS